MDQPLLATTIGTMYLREVTIEGYRCFKKATFNFQNGFNSVVGRNNTGKTSLFNGIRHALGSSANRGEPLWLTEEDFYFEPAVGKRTEKIQIELQFAGLNGDDLARFFEILDYNVAQPLESVGRIVFEASWPEAKPRPDTKRWGGASTGDRAAVPSEVLAQIPVTFLPALRDAEAALTPGNKSRLALLLQDLARRDAANPKDTIIEIFKTANAALEQTGLLKTVKERLQKSTGAMAGSDYSPCSISASTPRFERILRTLRVQMETVALADISANGLGYNNLLYIATVLAHLEEISDSEAPLLLVEEPESHLHPQLTVLLAEYLNQLTAEARAPQVIVTTHSPTLASHLAPSRISITFVDSQQKTIRCNSLVHAGLEDHEEREIRRMLDVTRASLYFAKGLILVEGISESLLLPVLAKRMGINPLERHISILPMCGVAFGTFKKLLSENALNIPVAIITDGDPRRTTKDWETTEPRMDGGKIERCARAKKLEEVFAGHANVKVFISEVTLEYDLAMAGHGNPAVMAQTWEDCFDGTPRTFSKAVLAAAGADLRNQALAVWRGICVADSAGSKAEFANLLADALALEENGQPTVPFVIPAYLQNAIRSVWDSLEPPLPAAVQALI